MPDSPLTPPPLDERAALSKIDGDRDILGEMAEIFLDCLPALLADIRESIQQRQGPALRARAHRLKSSLANFFAARAQQSVVRLEEVGKNEEWSGVEDAWAELQESMGELEPELRRLAAARG